MRLIKPDTRIDFLGKRFIAFVVSIVLVAVSLGSLAIQNLALGVDFTGGAVIAVSYPEAVEIENVRGALSEGGLPDASVQFFGTSRDVMIRLAPQQGADTADISTSVLNALEARNAGVELQRVEFVGPQVGEELVNRGGLALLYTMIAILIYVIVRFHWKLATGAVVALAHDLIVTVGVFSLFQWDFDLTVLAALLAVLGYSINDTIVVFDRGRENFRRMRKATPFEVMNSSVNQTLGRTLMTSLTTLLTVAALFVLGGEAVHGFATALMIGVIVGTYSSVFVASALALQLDITKEDLFPPREEDAEKDARPTR